MRRLLPSTILILLFIISTLIGYSSSIYFHIAETERKCFIEEIPDETMVMSRYKVQLFDPNTKAFGDYPTIGMHVEVKDPEEKVWCLFFWGFKDNPGPLSPSWELSYNSR
uniref:GOLD domain-containing protein n=1 Tax=Meloidogyne enterolobii TaxID=390850 RepID=A0A6V7TI04_MELEN|nr:unnamed protein product [Meloidogyne enterolobii]